MEATATAYRIWGMKKVVKYKRTSLIWGLILISKQIYQKTSNKLDLDK